MQFVKEKVIHPKTSTNSCTPFISVSREYLSVNNLMDNCIILHGLQQNDECVSYHGPYDIGRNIQHLDFMRPIDIESIKGNVLIMLAPIHEWKLDKWKSCSVIHISLTCTPNSDDYVILMIASHNPSKVNEDSLWNKHFVMGIKNHFNTTMTGDGKKHHKSVGDYFGFGITAKYSTTNGQSYGVMANKKSSDMSLHTKYLDILKNDISFA